jgi:hypothetical protein
MKLRNWAAAAALVLGTVGLALPAQAALVRMFMHEEVADYAVWRKVYDDNLPDRQKLGVTFQAVFRSFDNPNEVTVFQDFRSFEEAKAYAASPEFKGLLTRGGVKGAPQIWYAVKALN